jgi:voltage-gated potassium channel
VSEIRKLLTATPVSFLVAILLPLVLVAIGTSGYMLIEGWSGLDSLYMTVITLTTVGYREVQPLSRNGLIFTMLLAMGGIYTLFYATGSVIAMVVHGDLLDFFGSRRMQRELDKLHGHLIVCGYGRMGRLVCEQFQAARVPFVVVDRNAELFSPDAHRPDLFLHGDATTDEVLERAGVRRARGLISVVASDADNLYITMSSRLLNDRLFIVARAEDERSEQKLLRGGASRVVSPYMIGGARVAQAVLRPNVVDFLELATRTEHLELNIEEAQLSPESKLVGRTLGEAEIQREKLLIVAIMRTSGKMIFNPPTDTKLAAGDVMIMMGGRQELDRLAELAGLAPGAAPTA